MRLFDAYAAAREAAAALLCRAGFAGADADDVRACSSGAPLASALPLSRGFDAEACLRAVHAAGAERPEMLLHAPAFRNITAEGGHLCFYLTDAAYGALMRGVIASCPPPPLPENTESPLGYAVARMHMLARLQSDGCPGDDAVRRAVWLAFGVAQAGIGTGERRARAEKAARALLSMAYGLPPRARMELLRGCGDVGKCAMRLLAYAREGCYGKPT